MRSSLGFLARVAGRMVGSLTEIRKSILGKDNTHLCLDTLQLRGRQDTLASRWNTVPFAHFYVALKIYG